MRSSVKLNVKEINRIVRYLPKDILNRIDYYNFLKLVERVDLTTTALEQVSDSHDFAEKLGSYIKERKFTVTSFIKTVCKHIA